MYSNYNNIVKKFKEFNPMRKWAKISNQLVIEGTVKKFFKKADFEIVIYYTPIRKTIINIHSDINVKKLNLTFKIGDNLDKAIKWIDKNKHQIKYNIKKQ